MRVSRQSRPYHRWRLPLAYTLAVLIPVLNTWLVESFYSLRAIPHSPYLIGIVIISYLGGLAPALASVPVSFFCHLYMEHAHVRQALRLRDDLLHAGVLLLAALVLWLFDLSRRSSERRLSATLEQLQERSSNLLDSLTGNKCACWSIDLDSGRSARWFGGNYQLFGRPYEELEALPSLLPLLHPDDQPRLRELIQVMRSDAAPVTFEHRVPWPNGELHTLEMRGHRVSDKPCVWRGITVDITERKVTEAALLRSEKLAAMGRIASTVAHEINNPLEAVTNLLYLAHTDPTLSESTLAYLNTAQRELARLGNITRLTLGFVRSSGTASSIKLTSVIEDVLSIFAHRFEMKSIHIERRYQPGVFVHLPPHELRQVVTNLIANAADAVSAPGARILLHVRQEAELAVLLVEDNGCGIDSSDLPRVFEPFFTTKEEVGTGIGLWVTRELVEKNGGHIRVQTSGLEPGLSTCFRVELPLSPAPASASQDADHLAGTSDDPPFEPVAQIEQTLS